ncbi:uncharacterized protein LOC130621316 [Hydractinia symbiolongicarpus]|uniref:uncharacterized protein LOC130621309 n=2 Tax=Hydractinia symbiolongicarpus TaxID=13093 RepID=UPI00254F9703|nr:uncharacterized protein LOC130621309 [Hydractinia symbiolongicarpus]XP_057292594.1 uncharacterized protein LOC130621312 [Hydractinia symbiolongicarpus]XP_057292596.1 uncharacterized protein LOC130621314 [Hydractinia symbiolongicarpus]XP_057292597.1 uncharacterized protein LOC130621315 [Hydractinia symbiolongicarpus]XP_057292598.1 uncharacterized protein LOC130621316 [Hydractinia symbiolongicarpus]
MVSALYCNTSPAGTFLANFFVKSVNDEIDLKIDNLLSHNPNGSGAAGDTSQDSSRPAQIEGRINYPQVFPDQIPDGSCMVINVFDTSSKPSKFVTKQVIDNPMKDARIEYLLKLPKDQDLSNAALQKLKISAYVNVGWCSKDQTSSEDPKDNTKQQDYATEMPYAIDPSLSAITMTSKRSPKAKPKIRIIRGPEIYLEKVTKDMKATLSPTNLNSGSVSPTSSTQTGKKTILLYPAKTCK